jgi:5'-deoxynucleotidase YfbR-like HD superfamily hydrolase
MSKKHFRISLCINVAVIIGFAIAFVALFNYCSKQTLKERTYIFNADNIDVPQEGVELSINMPADKQWLDSEHHPDLPFGAQYDFIVVNNTQYEIMDWRVDIVFSDDLYIDSSWNGLFSTQDRTVNFAPTGRIVEVQEQEIATFGAIMYSQNLMSVKQCTIHCRRAMNITDLKAFWILLIAAVIWAIALIVFIVTYIRLSRYRRQQKLDTEIIEQSMNTFIEFIDAKDANTKGHSTRVATYSAEIARRKKLPEKQVRQLYYITLMHDCGKIGIPDSILKKPGPLTDEEYSTIKGHTTLGVSILTNFTAIPGIQDGAHYHHERYDGKGYPEGLKGSEIPLYARIICVADSYDAMSSARCYRKALDPDTILKELLENAGKQFDPEIVPYMISMIEDGFTDNVKANHPHPNL